MSVIALKPVSSIFEIKEEIHRSSIILLYISRENCSVCHALLPQIEDVLMEFPMIEARSVDADLVPEIAGEYTIFTVPAILVFVNGKEMIRKARFVPIDMFRLELKKLLKYF